MAISTKKDLEAKYFQFLKDKNNEINKLEALFKVPNLFEILKIERFEIRHSNFLAWLLDPKGSHGLGSNFIRRFLYDIALDDRSHNFSVFEVNNLNFESVSIRREWNNIDILIVFDDYVFIIENKVHHKETNGQLIKYLETVTSAFPEPKYKIVGVFLNVDGYESSLPDKYINFSFETILKYLEQLLKIDTTLNERAKIYIEDYITSVRNNIMENSEKFLLANKIYQNHKELFDFVISFKTNLMYHIKSEVGNKIKERGWQITSDNSKYFIRFITPNLKELVQGDYKKDWNTGEYFLFEILFENQENYIMPYCTVRRDEKESDKRKILLDSLKQLNDNTNYTASKWNCYEFTKFEINSYNHEINSIEKIVTDILNAVDTMVEKIEPLILSKKEQLTNTK